VIGFEGIPVWQLNNNPVTGEIATGILHIPHSYFNYSFSLEHIKDTNC